MRPEAKRQAKIIKEQAASLEHHAELVQQQSKTIKTLHDEIEKQRRDLDLLRRYIYGQRSERIIGDAAQQGTLFDLDDSSATNEPDDEEDEDDRPRKRRKGHGRRKLPSHLPRKEIRHILEGDALLCPCCGKPRVKISEELSEQLEHIPASLFVNQHICEIYACKDDECLESSIVKAPKPPQPIDKGLAGPGLLAHVVTSKLADHLPLYRQEDILARSGVHLRRSTLCGWMEQCSQLAKPLYMLLMRRVLQSHVVGVDDTTVQVRDTSLNHTRRAYFWEYYGDDSNPYVCFDFSTSRARAGPETLLAKFKGILQGDGYWENITDAIPALSGFAGCMAHARRKFEQSLEKAPSRDVHDALAYIQRLYDIEDQARDMTDGERLSLREQKAVPILDRFKEWLDTKRGSVIPSSALGEAITYATNQWTSLLVYTRHGDVPIDNNRVEGMIRYPVIGRCNWLFLGSDNGGHTAAVLYSLVITCKRLRIDPWAYLNNVFTRLPSASPLELRHLLPDRWIRKHPKHRLVYREKEARLATQRRKARREKRRREIEAAMAD